MRWTCFRFPRLWTTVFSTVVLNKERMQDQVAHRIRKQRSCPEYPVRTYIAIKNEVMQVVARVGLWRRVKQGDLVGRILWEAEMDWGG